MGTVYRALDRANGDAPVALKVLQRVVEADVERFRREARMLRVVSHPDVLRYVSDGTHGSDAFLVTEWLEGEDLQARLAREGMTLAETVALARRVASALDAVHERGLVHRDLKPSNLFLVDKQPEKLKLLDFGLARMGNAANNITQTGVLMGTPGYMAPEQARGDVTLDGRADLFALGCVLYKCLTGEAPFHGTHVVATLARILIEDPPAPSTIRGDIPAALDALVLQLLDKDPSRRPADARAVLAQLDALGPIRRSARGRSSARMEALTGLERRVLCVVLAAPRGREGARPADELAWAKEHFEPSGLRVEPMREGSIVAVVTEAGSAVDLAVRAARAASQMRARWPDAAIALSTGAAESTARVPVGMILDNAAIAVATAPAGTIAIDDSSASLLEPYFDVEIHGRRARLGREREHDDGARTLLGKSSPCIGRERELSTLQALLDQSIDERVARATIVTAPPGIGKTRVRQAFVDRARKAHGDAFVLLFARGDSLRAGSPFSLIAQLLRRASQIPDDATPALRAERLRERLSRALAGDALDQCHTFLGELIGAEPPSEPSEALRAARRDPVLMGESMRGAWEQWLLAESESRAILLVIEDLHWGDLPTVKFVDAALRALHDRPLMVLALARPEVHAAFPDLWSARALQVMPLDALTKKSAEKLVHNALGESCTPALAAQLAERSQGNAFFLEELIRAVDRNGPSAALSLPDSVLATLQVRLDALTAEARRVLRAASVFGETFHHGGVAALLEGKRATSTLADPLRDLVEREVIIRKPSSSIEGETEYVFRHALVRDAAYAMLTEGDRTLGHKLAGRWLESTGIDDALLLAEHFRMGRVAGRAAVCYRRAAEQALEGNDLVAAISRSARGIDCERTARTQIAASRDQPTLVARPSSSGSPRPAESHLYGELRLVQSIAEYWRANYAVAAESAEAAADALEEASAPWYRAVAEAIVASARAGLNERVEHWVSTLLATSAAEDARSTQVVCLARAAIQLLFTGNQSRAHTLFCALESHTGDGAGLDAVAVAQSIHSRCVRAGHAGNHGEFRQLLTQALAWFARGGDVRNVCLESPTLGWVIAELGDFAQAEQSLRTSLATAERMGVRQAITFAEHLLGNVLAYRGALDEARARELRAIEACVAQGNRRLEGWSRVHLSTIELFAGDFAASEREAREASALLTVSPGLRVYARACVARAMLAKGERIGAALREVSEAHAELASIGALLEGESVVHLVYAEALLAAGETSRAREAFHRAYERLMQRADAIAVPEWRRDFLERPENRATLARFHSHAHAEAVAS